MNAPTEMKGLTTVEHGTQDMSTGAMVFDFSRIEKMNELAVMMATSKVAVPQHFRNSPGDCLAVVMQSVQWGMNPFAVAQKTFAIKGVLGYEAQLVNAVVTARAPIVGRFHYEWFGPWEKVLGKFREGESKNKIDEDTGEKVKYRVPAWTMADEAGIGIRVSATFKGESEPRVLELMLIQARTRNSTLWADDPKQQLAYLAVKRWARLYCPDVILGVYTTDELEPIPAEPKDITPGAEPAPKAQQPLPSYSQDSFERNFPTWDAAIKAGRKSADQIIKTLETKSKLTDDMKKKIRDAEIIEGEQAGDDNDEFFNSYDKAAEAGEQQ